MIKILIPVMLLAIIALTVLIIHKREARVKHLRNVEREHERLVNLVDALDSAAASEYTVTNSPFAGYVLDAIRRHDSAKKEIV